MKKKLQYFIFILILIINIIFPNYIYADNKEDIFKKLNAPNLLLGEINTENILYERAADKKIYPASVTKLMTAILVLENCELDEIVTVSENAVFSVPSGYVNANLQVGEELTIEDLLYVMLIPSANDAANALAEHVGGSIESFSTMMNTRAKELGCTGTNFTNPSGLHQVTHYTTTRDLYYISREAIKNPVIKKIIATTRYTLPETNKYTNTKSKRTFVNSNYMIRESLTKYYCDYCIGGKTGYTPEAKNCVVEYAVKDGIELIAVVMGESASVKGQKFLDAKIMFEYVFKNYENKSVAVKDEKYDTIKIENGTKATRDLEVLYKDNVNILKKTDDIQEIQEKIEYNNLNAPIQKGEVIGKISYAYDGITYTTDIIANSDVEESKVLSNLVKLLAVLLIIYIIYYLRKSKKNYKRHGKNLRKKLKKKR